MSHQSVTRWFGIALVGCLIGCSQLASSQASSSVNAVPASNLGISFVEGSVSQVIVERDGMKYVVDLASHQITRADAPSQGASTGPTQSVTAGAQPATAQSATEKSASAKSKFYKPGDDFLFNVPTGRPVERHSLVINFTHRFP